MTQSKLHLDPLNGLRMMLICGCVSAIVCPAGAVILGLDGAEFGHIPLNSLLPANIQNS